jgi:hypothetical protein
MLGRLRGEPCYEEVPADALVDVADAPNALPRTYFGVADRSALRKGSTGQSARSHSVSDLVLIRAPDLY